MSNVIEADAGNSTAQLAYEGFSIDLLENIAKMCDFDYRIIESKDGHYGAPTEDGRWTGLIGQLQRWVGYCSMC